LNRAGKLADAGPEPGSLHPRTKDRALPRLH
jgi:hypothetical protein